MLFLVFFLFIKCIYCYTPIYANFTVKYYTQKVDHFNYGIDDKFVQRVIISTDHWCNDGCPIFFYTGNEGDIFTFVNNTGFMWENAQRFKAMIVFAEHRYYGTSLPYGKDSFKDKVKVGYLNVGQALADFAEIILDIKTKQSAKNSPVIAFGGSYGGMLAAWIRMKYPHLIEGAIASSAPLIQFPGLYECSKYAEVCTESFKKYPQCAESIFRSWDVIKHMSLESDGREWITNTFKLCKPFEKDDLKAFLDWLMDIYGNLCMIDYPNPADFLAPLPAYPIKVVCNYLQNSTVNDKELLSNIYEAISVYTNYSSQTECHDFNEYSSRLGYNQWEYQTCTEMVMPLCFGTSNDMFFYKPWNITEISDECNKTWGVTPEPNKAYLLFGGYNISSTSNIIFSNGQRDPWGPGGINSNISDSIISITIENACHHEDLRASGQNDPIPLLEAREFEITIIKKWIENYYNRIKHWPQEWIKTLDLI